MKINWHPGHMRLTRELLQKKLKIVDIVFELLDARAPISSKNVEIDKLIGQKPRLVILNKSDLSSENGNIKWMNYLDKKYEKAIAINATGKGNLKKINNAVQEITNRSTVSIKAMVIGVPNVGKSTLINNLSARKGTQIGNKPGITKTVQWIKINNKFELLDTPGLLNLSSGSNVNTLYLSFIGAIKDEILDLETTVLKLLEILINLTPDCLEKRYKISVQGKSPREVFTEIATKRGCIAKNRGVDFQRAAVMILSEYRKGMIGKLTLEYPEY